MRIIQQAPYILETRLVLKFLKPMGKLLKFRERLRYPQLIAWQIQMLLSGIGWDLMSTALNKRALALTVTARKPVILGGGKCIQQIMPNTTVRPVCPLMPATASLLKCSILG